jgi:uncharacterized protein YndB with AHSA1/START domain
MWQVLTPISQGGPKVLELDARVGGEHHMSFTNFSAGQSHSFGGTYLELVSHVRICNADVFDSPNFPGELIVARSHALSFTNEPNRRVLASIQMRR